MLLLYFGERLVYSCTWEKWIPTLEDNMSDKDVLRHNTISGEWTG